MLIFAVVKFSGRHIVDIEDFMMSIAIFAISAKHPRSCVSEIARIVLVEIAVPKRDCKTVHYSGQTP